MFTIYIVLSVFPALLLLWYFYRKDKNQPEPKNAILKVFFLGMFLLVPDLLLEVSTGYLLFGRPTFDWGSGPVTVANAFLVGFVQAALIEESMKMILMIVLVYQMKEFNERADGIVYTVVLGLGFASIENLTYVAGGGVLIGLLRAFTAVPMHAVASALMGYFIGTAKFAAPAQRPVLFITGWIIAVVFHGVYNTFAFMQNIYSFFIVVIVGGGLIISVKLLNALVAKDKTDLFATDSLKQ